jgi:hypothetical protein
VSGPLHTSATFSLEMPPVLLNKKLAGPRYQRGILGKDENVFPPRGIETPTVGYFVFRVWGKARNMARVAGLPHILKYMISGASTQNDSSFDSEVRWPWECTLVTFCRWQHCIRVVTLASRRFFAPRASKSKARWRYFIWFLFPALLMRFLYISSIRSRTRTFFLTLIWNMWFKPFNFLFTEKRKKWMKAAVICTQCLIDSFKCEVRCYFQVLSAEVNHRPNIRFGIRFTDTSFCLSNMSETF